MITHRRICWPDPDATCLEGGCIHCNDYPYRKVTEISRWAVLSGPVNDRCGDQTKDAYSAYLWGCARGWPGIEQKP